MAAAVPRRGALVRFLRVACCGPVRGVAVRVALTVGTILNLINQGGPLIAGEGISWTHVALNYLVPYCVSSYSAARNEMRRGG